MNGRLIHIASALFITMTLMPCTRSDAAEIAQLHCIISGEDQHALSSGVVILTPDMLRSPLTVTVVNFGKAELPTNQQDPNYIFSYKVYSSSNQIIYERPREMPIGFHSTKTLSGNSLASYLVSYLPIIAHANPGQDGFSGALELKLEISVLDRDGRSLEVFNKQIKAFPREQSWINFATLSINDISSSPLRMQVANLLATSETGLKILFDYAILTKIDSEPEMSFFTYCARMIVQVSSPESMRALLDRLPVTEQGVRKRSTIAGCAKENAKLFEYIMKRPDFSNVTPTSVID